MENNTTITGKRGELLVMGKLMQMGLSVYIPVADIEGIDCIIRNDKKRLIEVQIKSRTKREEKFYFSIKNFQPHTDFFIICYVIDTNETWVIPSFLFYELSRQDNEHRYLTMDLNTERRLSEYKDNLGYGLLKLDKLERKFNNH